MENTTLQVLTDLMAQLPLVVAIATGLTEVIKRALSLQSDRFIPLVSVVIGAGTGLVLLGVSIPAAVLGVIAGLAGTGLWEFGKTTVAGK